MGKYNPAPYQLDLKHYPHLVSETIPGPKSNALHARAEKYYRGLSGQVRLFPVAESADADGLAGLAAFIEIPGKARQRNIGSHAAYSSHVACCLVA